MSNAADEASGLHQRAKDIQVFLEVDGGASKKDGHHAIC
jgi:hypothetical protein